MTQTQAGRHAPGPVFLFAPGNLIPYETKCFAVCGSSADPDKNSLDSEVQYGKIKTDKSADLRGVGKFSKEPGRAF